MSFAFTNLSIDIEKIIEENVSYRRNMNKVINKIKEASEETAKTCTYYYNQEEIDSECYYSEILEIYIDALDISIEFNANEELIQECYSTERRNTRLKRGMRNYDNFRFQQ